MKNACFANAVAAVIGGMAPVAPVAAFSPAPVFSPLVARISGPAISIRSPPTRRSPRRSPTIPKSSVSETFETEAANNETLGDDPSLLPIGETAPTEAAPTGSTIGNYTDKLRLREVLPPLELVDHSAILFDPAPLAGDAAVASEILSSISAASKDNISELSSGAYQPAPMAVFEEEVENKLLFYETTDDDNEALKRNLIEPGRNSNNPTDSLMQGLDSMGSGRNSNSLEQQTSADESILKNAPSVKKILRYTIPAIGIWLCSPVLSMIDTASVGLLSGTAQQAALNPAVSVADQGALVIAFMYTATTNLIAAAVQEDNDAAPATPTTNDDGSRPRTTATLVTALKLALFVGTVFGALLVASGNLLLELLMGNNESLDPVVFGAALRYVRIRALGMPAMAVIGTAQSACLGMRDVKSPLYVLMAAAAVNFLGDVMLVPLRSSMFGGAAGAAWATVASQYAALVFFGRWLTARGDVDKGAGEARKKDGGNKGNDTRIMDLTGTSMEGKSRREIFNKFLASPKLSRRIQTQLSSKIKTNKTSVIPPSATQPDNNNNVIRLKKQPPKIRGFLSNMTLRNYLSLSNLNRSTARKFLPFVIPVTTTSVGRISGYIAMSHVASSTLGTYDMAAHQIIFSIFCCLAPFVDALSQVAQSFVPAIFEAKGRSRARAMALRKTTNNFRKVGAGFGVVLVALVSCIPLMSSIFTTDPLVLARVNGAIPGVGLFLLVNGLMCAGEGTLLGHKDLKFLQNMYAIFFFAVPACMLRLKYRALGGLQVVGVGTMWAAFSTYNVIRTGIWHLRLAQLQRRTERGVVVDTGQNHQALDKDAK